MTNIDQMIQVSAKNFNIINKFCKPLLNHFGINNFSYNKIKNNGDFFSICSHVEWTEYYYSEKLYLHQPHWRHPKNFQSGISLPKLIANEGYQEVIKKAASEFNVNFSVLILNNVIDGMEIISLDVNTPCSSQDLLIVNEIGLIKRYVNKFISENEQLIRSAEEYQIDSNILIGKKFQSSDMVISANLKEKNQFLKEIGIEIPNSITSKDKEILFQMLQGNSAVQIATNLFLSPRTIEHRIENLKNKLSCFTKSELIFKAREFESVGFFVDQN